MSTPPNEFFIIDNGDRPFKVILHPDGEQRLDVYVGIYDRTTDWDHSKLWKTFEYDEIFIGQGVMDSTDYCEFSYGNAVLMRLKAAETLPLEFVYLGSRIIQFTSKALIEKFVSTIGNSDVPYSFARDVNGGHYFFQGSSLVEFVNGPLPKRVVNGKPRALYCYFYEQCCKRDYKDRVALDATLLHERNI